MTETKRKDAVELSQIKIDNEKFLKISNSDSMRPFFMSIVSHSNHWMFISSNGGLSAGRKNSENALFPYYTDDKITESAEITGSKSIFQVSRKGASYLWEPFSERQDGKYTLTRNLYKNTLGNKVIFEEINQDLSLTFRYQWNSSDRYGFVKKSSLTNDDSVDKVEVTLLDGIQNILPSGVGSFLQNQSSNLVDAYKRNQLVEGASFGIFALSAIIVDKAEPSEALKANVVYSLGLDQSEHLLSSLQLSKFRKGLPIQSESDVKAEKGAFFLHTKLTISAGASKEWMIVADVNKSHTATAELIHVLKTDSQLKSSIISDIELGSKNLRSLNAGADALQLTGDHLRDTRHFSNTLFNIMRGGIFDNNYVIERWDFIKYLSQANSEVYKEYAEKLKSLKNVFSLSDLNEFADKIPDEDLNRLVFEYMPLKFSRRHGDPSRPWNKFSINTRSEVDGSKILDYEGNWRDIFQNWEALALSYPDFVNSMIHKFLNATTFDGYNPYRVTKSGFDWESIEPDDPWSYIGYWGDHQIIYLQKLLELSENHNPGGLAKFFDKEIFVYANVPYKIKSYEEIVQNSKDTIDFDFDLDEKIRHRKESLGADGALLQNVKKSIHRANFIEKILATLLSKLSNFIPEGGIWMNTQRPEWNDANNALVGNGVSMVTLYYLRRFLKFFGALIADSDLKNVVISEEIGDFYSAISNVFAEHRDLLSNPISDADRKHILDALGKAGSDFRSQIYESSFSSNKQALDLAELRKFTEVTLVFIEHTISKNQRKDHLFHAYNLMTINEQRDVEVTHLSEMLEGQVAVLSSGYLSSRQALEVLDAMKSSALFRSDQYSYLLYPNKDLPRFLEKNDIKSASVKDSQLLNRMIKDGYQSIISKDINGDYHFNGNFKNASDLKEALSALSNSDYKTLAAEDGQQVLDLFEDVFDHKSFTGRSGTFYGYEGLGSIYWHMVSKLLLAVQECCIKAIRTGEDEVVVGKLLEHYYEINEGIGVHKSPSLYGAFPTDPYSHTPAGKGAQQPGMTGQVKEDILSRFGELGVFVKDGMISFDPILLRRSEFLDKAETFNYVNLDAESKQIQLASESLAFTYCQVPIIYQIADDSKITVFYKDMDDKVLKETSLNLKDSRKIFERTGHVVKVVVNVQESKLRV